MAKTSIRIEGLQQLKTAMQNLSEDVRKKVAFQAVLAGAGVIRKAAKVNAPVAAEAYEDEDGNLIQPGNIGKNIVTRRQKTTTPGQAAYVVTVKGKGKSVKGQPYRIGVLQEFGTVKQPPRPFMRPAFTGKKEAAVSAIVDRLRKRIAKANAGQG